MTDDAEYREFLEWKRFQEWRKANQDAPVPAAPAAPAPAKSEPTVRELWALYKAWGAPEPEGRGNVPSWQTNQRTHEVNILAYLGDLPASRVTIAKWEEFRDWLAKKKHQYGRGYQPGTRNHYLRTGKALYNWAVAREHVARNPIALVEFEAESTSREFHLTPDEFVRLLEHARPLLRTMAILSFETGMRLTECRELEKSWVDLRHALIVLPADATKGRYERRVPLSDAALAAVKSALDHGSIYGTRYVFANTHPDAAGRPINARAVQRWIEEAREKAGITGPKGQPVTFHNLRKSFGSLNAMAGMPIPQLMEIAGWRSMKVARKYISMNPQHLADARAFMNRRGTLQLVPHLAAEPLKRVK